MISISVTMLKLEVSTSVYFLNQSNFNKSFSFCSPHILICSWFSEHLCRIRYTIDYMGHNKNTRVKPYPEIYLQWTRQYQQDFTDEKVNNQSVRWKQAKLYSVVSQHCRLPPLTWFKNTKLFVFKKGIKNTNCCE